MATPPLRRNNTFLWGADARRSAAADWELIHVCTAHTTSRPRRIFAGRVAPETAAGHGICVLSC